MTGSDLAGILRGLDANPPATTGSIAEAEEALGFSLPPHYRRFLMHADGCEGVLGEGYVALWSVRDLAELQDAYCVSEFVDGLLLIGSDGGDTAYALDLSAEGAPVVSVPFIPVADELIDLVGATIADLLVAIRTAAPTEVLS